MTQHEGLDRSWIIILHVFVCVAVQLHSERLLPLSEAEEKKKVAVCLMPYQYEKPFIIDEDILFQETDLLLQVKNRAPFSRPGSVSSPTVM